ncbi:helix-turn-helix domain-containing protein [Actinoplanes xinjiangensis]|uniref:DNA-binding XRE family transcriptional regulator n=1 Tax=Actinoplanes xinjiangensis TaxID=512350 RepID=A0A316FG90_9ACTN|nr:helix-turn-helix transcriptional regulator [Actinoplanes xinjiangensis]PWK46736.1 DNA-binding XRE family transcriptional regulator [Actinoplanes xinjiangensis]
MATQIVQPEFGRRLRRLRIERGMSQRDLAVGVVNQSYISLLEKGSRVPTLDVVNHLSEVLGVPVDELAGVETGFAPPPAAPGVSGTELARELIVSSAVDQGDLSRAEQVLTGALQEARRDGQPAAMLSHGLALERIMDQRNDRSGRYELLNELVTVAERAGVPEALVRTRIALAAAARDVGRLTEAFTHIEQAQAEIAETAFVGGSEHVRLHAVHISILSDAGGGAEVTRIVDRMVAMAADVKSLTISGRAHWVASIAMARIGEVERSLEHLRSAREMLAHPTTSLRDWARFSIAAVSALMDADVELSEITSRMEAARAAMAAAETAATPSAAASLEVRYAVAVGEPERALEIAATVDETDLSGIEQVRFVLAVGRAQRRCGRTAEAAASLRRAAQLAEAAAAYRRASQIWREVTELG